MDIIPICLRVDKDLRDKIQKLADEEHRSFSAQIRYILKQYIKQKKNN